MQTLRRESPLRFIIARYSKDMPDMPIPPPRTTDQRHNALQYANDIRRRRASDKAQLRARTLDARDLLVAPPLHWERAHIADLLLALPGVGHSKVQRILEATDISSSRTLSGLTENQIERLQEKITPYCLLAEDPS